MTPRFKTISVAVRATLLSGAAGLAPSVGIQMLCLAAVLPVAAQAQSGTSVNLYFPGSSNYVNQSLTLSSVVTPQTSGTVTFLANGASVGAAAVVPISGGSYASLTLPAGALPVGDYTLQASYLSGQAGASAVLSLAWPYTIKAAPVFPAVPVSATPVTNFEYDAQGNPTKSIVAPTTKALATSTTYDALNRQMASFNAKNGITQFTYDGLDQTTSITDPRQLVTQYQTTGAGTVTRVQSPDTGVANSTFDAAGNLKTRTDARGVLASYSYDVLNRLAQVTYSQGGASRQVAYTYDQTGANFGAGIGRLTTGAAAEVTTQLRYDTLGRVTQTVQTATSQATNQANNPGFAVSYAYDTAGHITGITYPSGRVVTFNWSGGQPQSVGVAASANIGAVPLLDQVQMTAFGPVKSWVWQMGATPKPYVRTFDTNGRLVRHPLGNLVRDLSYDEADRIVAYTHYDADTAASVPTYNQSFSYDELGRVISANSANGSWAYSYDASGNRTASAVGATARAFTIDSSSNRLTGLSNPVRSFSYDAAGNTNSDVQSGASSNYSASYNLEGQLNNLNQGSSAGVDFYYDAWGHRVVRSSWVSSPSTRTVTVFVYDQSNHLLGEYTPSGAPISEYVWLGETPVGLIKPAGSGIALYAIHSDHLDTPRVIMDVQGRVRWRWIGEPFGNHLPEEQPTAGQAAISQNLRFPGQEYDGFGGRHYNFARWYEPATGRYVQSDPIGLGGGINTYAYVQGNPQNFADPLGLFEVRGYPSNVFDKRKYPGNVQELYKHAENLKRLIEKACPGNNKAKELYEKWVAKIVARDGNPTTMYGLNTSEFTRDYFDTSTHRPDSPDNQFVFMHEFMHLTDENHRLSPSTGTYVEATINQTTSNLPIEKNADQMVRDLMNGKCPCN